MKKNVKEKSNQKNKKKRKPENKLIDKQKFSTKHPKISLTLKIFLLLILALIVIATGIVVGMLYGGWGADFEITKDELVIGSSNSIILDKDGNKLAELTGDANRKIIKLDQIPKNLQNAYVAIEDERFYEHKGIDFKRTGGAIFKYIMSRGNASFGGSTITQQLVKNLTQEKDRTGLAGILRKVKEWAKAYQIERMISKDQILELYFNIIFVGGNNNNLGVEVGSEYYFNKSAKDLDLSECAFLAGINNSPNKYNPYDESNKDKIKTRTKTVLGKMLELGYISQEEYDSAVAKVDEGLHFEQAATRGTNYSYHTDATIAQVIEDIANEKGISKALASTYLYSSGLTIYSTQDTDLQSKMDSVIQNDSGAYVRKSKLVDGATSETAMVIIDNNTGYVVGVEGGLGQKTESRGLNRATQSPRQTGSSIKPLTSLVPGINEGVITAASVYDDTKATFNIAPGWDPKDYNTPRGLISIREAIRTSQNLPFIKVVAELTPAKSTEYLQKMGVTTVEKDKDIIAALSIGGFTDGITPLEMAGAYACIANKGIYRRPLFYTKIIDSDGNTVMEAKQSTEQVISEQAAYVITNMLQTVVQSGTATYCKISGQDVAAKTGTTNSNYDKWLCGFTKHYTASCWYGFDKNEEVTGSTNVAGKIWSAVMSKVHSGKESGKFEKPSGVVSASICRLSGKRATGRCSDTYSEIFVEGTVPGECDAHKSSAQICEETGLLANENCPKKVTKYYSYVVEKERLKLWKNKNSSVRTAPTTYCTTHNSKNNTAHTTPKKEEPTITINGETSMTLNVGDVYTEKGATAKDDTDGDITSKIKIEGSVNTSKAGTYTIKYEVTNSKGKVTIAKRIITVKAKETPKPEKPAETQNTTNNQNTEKKDEKKETTDTEKKEDKKETE